MDQQAPDSSTPMESSTIEHFDMSPRTTSKRQVENDDMDDDSPDKRLRPRSPIVSYRTDADSDGMDDGTLSGLNEIDRIIVSAAIMGVITEVFSLERVVQVAKRFGLTAGSSMDLTKDGISIEMTTSVRRGQWSRRRHRCCSLDPRRACTSVSCKS